MTRRIKKVSRASEPFRCSSAFKPAVDDWFPNFGDGTVQVSMLALSTGQTRVCVWGADDHGLEIDLTDKRRARFIFRRLLNCAFIDHATCRDLGLTPA